MRSGAALKLWPGVFPFAMAQVRCPLMPRYEQRSFLGSASGARFRVYVLRTTWGCGISLLLGSSPRRIRSAAEWDLPILIRGSRAHDKKSQEEDGNRVIVLRP